MAVKKAGSKVTDLKVKKAAAAKVKGGASSLGPLD